MFLMLLALLTMGADMVGQTLASKEGAVKKTVEVTIYFRANSFVVDNTYMDNRETLAHLDRTVNSLPSAIDSIVVFAVSSPEGDYSSNALLTIRRAEAIREYLFLRYPMFESVRIIVRSYPPTWEGIREVVESDNNIPAQGELIRIITSPDLSEAEKNRQVRTIASGKTFYYLVYNILPYLRKSSIDFRFSSSKTDETLLPPIEEVSPPEEPAQIEEVPSPIENVTKPAVEEEVEIIITPEERKSPAEIRYKFALRSNLLSDLILAPNIGIEVPIGSHFSIAGDFVYGYWQTKNDRFALQTIQGNIEGRYWFLWKEKPLTGWNVGAYATLGGRYDVQWNTGYQGDNFWSSGLVGGYSLSLSRVFNLDFSLAAGYIGTSEVRVYNRPQNGHLIWKETRYNTGMFSITKARVSLVWLLGTHKY